MRHNATTRIEGMRRRIMHQVRNIARINVGKAKQSPRKVRWIVISSKNASKLIVEHSLCGLPKTKPKKRRFSAEFFAKIDFFRKIFKTSFLFSHKNIEKHLKLKKKKAKIKT